MAKHRQGVYLWGLLWLWLYSINSHVPWNSSIVVFGNTVRTASSSHSIKWLSSVEQGTWAHSLDRPHYVKKCSVVLWRNIERNRIQSNFLQVTIIGRVGNVVRSLYRPHSLKKHPRILSGNIVYFADSSRSLKFPGSLKGWKSGEECNKFPMVDIKQQHYSILSPFTLL